jgi:hypothetical protein
MLNYKDYELIFDGDNNYIIGYKEEVVRFLKDNLKNYIDQDFEKENIEEELERLTIVKNSKYDGSDLIRVKNNDEERCHIPTKPIASVKVLIPYGRGFSGMDVAKYMI